jgi:hypothetical protein
MVGSSPEPAADVSAVEVAPSAPVPEVYSLSSIKLETFSTIKHLSTIELNYSIAF